MGFRQGSYAKIWEIKPFSDKMVRARASISKKNRMTGEYETEFSGWIKFVGSAMASRANALHEGDRIRIGDCDVVRRWVDKTREQVQKEVEEYAALFNITDPAIINEAVTAKMGGKHGTEFTDFIVWGFEDADAPAQQPAANVDTSFVNVPDGNGFEGDGELPW